MCNPPKKRRYFTTELPCSGSLYNLFLSLYNLLYNFNIKCSECLLSPTVSTHQLLFIKTPIDQYICVIVNLYKAKHHKPSLLFTSWTILTFFPVLTFLFYYSHFFEYLTYRPTSLPERLETLKLTKIA